MKKILLSVLILCVLIGCEEKIDKDVFEEEIFKNEAEVLELKEEINALRLSNDNMKLENEKMQVQIEKIELQNNEMNEQIEDYSDIIDKLFNSAELYSVDHKDLDKMLVFVPEGWQLSTYSNGDIALDKGKLNHDEFEDVALIIEHADSGDRELLILLGDENEMYNLAYQCKNAVLNLYAGGGFGNPLMNLTIEDHELNLNFFGGGFGRFFMDFKFAFLDNDLVLIYEKTGYHTPVENDVLIEYIEIDYLKGTLIKEVIVDNMLVKNSRQVQSNELIVIDDFEASVKLQ